MVDDKKLSNAIREVLRNRSVAALLTIVESGALAAGVKLLILNGREQIGDLGSPELNAAAVQAAADFLRTRDEARVLTVAEFAPDIENLQQTKILFERIETEPRLVIGGAGHVGAALARLAALVGYRVTLIDDRAEFVNRTLFSAAAEAGIQLIAAENWVEAIREAVGSGRGVAVAIVTRGHKQDEECLRAAAVAHPDYIGMIGSRRRTNIVLDKLREEGFSAEQLEKVRAPIGLDLGAVSPEEVALAILAEIVAERRGGAGGSLSAWRRT